MTWAFIVDSIDFTREVIAGKTSLGGSESACLGLARALKARGHDVRIFATRLADDAAGPDQAGVVWHPLDDFQVMNQFIEWDVVCSLRMYGAFAFTPIYARLRLLWNQDLLVPGRMQDGVMAISHAVDHFCYVSEYHRRQWEQLQPELAPLGWVTRNGIDLADVPHGRQKDPNRIIHISRPERGLSPLLMMWPALRQQNPQATLQICRYNSMYDKDGWGAVCAEFDREVARVNEQVGGITYLGELTKSDLYKAISDAAVMWYPGVSTFAETNCIAALEAAACGTPFVGSHRGALPETSPTGILIRGEHKDPAYQSASINAVLEIMHECKRQSAEYRTIQRDGRAEAARWSYTNLAAQWEDQVRGWFYDRYSQNKTGVLKQLLHEDDHVGARMVATEIYDSKTVDWCDYVIAGKDHDSDHYAAAAIPDPLREAEISGRFKAVIPEFEGCKSVLDVACGNGSFAIALALANPDVQVFGIDYAQANIDKARDGAVRAGVSDRCAFSCVAVYDFETQRMHDDWEGYVSSPRSFDGLFVGEFLEHVAAYRMLIDNLESVVRDGGVAVYTCPHGACAEMVPRNVPLRRGHVHRFHHDDLVSVFGQKRDLAVNYCAGGMTERGNPIGNWIIRYEVEAGRPTGERAWERISRTRPFQKLSVGLIVKDAENDLGRCLASVYKVADEIVVGDTGSTDNTVAIAQSYGAKVLRIDSVFDQPEGFAGARNAVLSFCTGDWFLWIDADEQLINGPLLRRYMDGAIWGGYILRQHHVYLDGPPSYDIPVRLFRNTGRVKFYGCIHEQPQDGDPNKDIHPSLDVGDVLIAHTGYLTQQGREEKRVERNLPLLLRDQKVFPTRTLGQVLLLREAVIQADVECANAGQMTAHAQQGYAHAIRIFVEHFDDPKHKFHHLVRPWYEAALKHLGLGWEHEIALAGKEGEIGANQHAKVERVRVRDGAEYERVMAHKVSALAERMRPPSFITDPDDERLHQPVAELSVSA